MIPHIFMLILSCSGHDCPPFGSKFITTYKTERECDKVGETYMKLDTKTSRWGYSCHPAPVK